MSRGAPQLHPDRFPSVRADGLGRLPAAHFLGGRMALDVAAAESALAELGRRIGADATRAALGVVRVANATMERAVRTMSVERGHDPRQFTLVAFGGAGPLHACDLAAALDMRRVLIPRHPGILCALGLLAADLSHDLSQSLLAPLAAVSVDALARRFAPLIDAGQAALRRQGAPLSRMTLDLSLDMRYVGQSFEITTPLVRTHPATRQRLTHDLAAIDIAARFHRLHRRRYGHASPAEPVEIVNLRLRAVARTDKPTFIAEAEGDADAGEQQSTPIYARDHLHAGNCIAGPAVVVQMDATTLIAPEWTARVDGYGNLLLHLREG